MYGGRADQTKNCLRKYRPEVISNSNLREAQFWCRFRFYSYSTSKQFFLGGGGGKWGWKSWVKFKLNFKIKCKHKVEIKFTFKIYFEFENWSKGVQSRYVGKRVGGLFLLRHWWTIKSFWKILMSQKEFIFFVFSFCKFVFFKSSFENLKLRVISKISYWSACNIH